MILEDFIQCSPQGLYCKYGDFFLDPQQPVSCAVISHAHGDHAVGGNKTVYATLPTRLFMELRYKRMAAETFEVKTYHQSFELGPVEICFIPAGHMLGSAMVLMIYKGIRYLYTGDYKCAADPSCEALEYVAADVLITESTFADPEVKHPLAETEVLKVKDHPGNLMMGVYALGKAQRMIQLINTYCPGKQILVHHNIYGFCQLYEQLGIELGPYLRYDRKMMKQASANHIYLVPPLVFNRYAKAVNVQKVFVSGWKRLQRGNDLQLLISDHVDWSDILHTIEQVKPQEVWTLHGDGALLKEYFKDRLKVVLLH